MPVAVHSPFTIGLSQVDGLDAIDDLFAQVDLAGLVETLFGAITIPGASGPFTIGGSSQVDGLDQVDASAGLRAVQLSGFNARPSFGSLSGGAYHLAGLDARPQFGQLFVQPGGFGQFGYAKFGDNTFGGDFVPPKPASGVPFTVDDSSIDGTDQIDGNASAAGQGVQLGGLDARPAFGALGRFNVQAFLQGLDARPLFGQLSTSGSTAFGLVGLDARAQFGSLRIRGTITFTGLDARPSFGSLVFNLQVFLAGLDASARFGTLGTAPGAAPVTLAGLDARPQFGVLHMKLHIPPKVLSTSAGLVRHRNAVVLT